MDTQPDALEMLQDVGPEHPLDEEDILSMDTRTTAKRDPYADWRLVYADETSGEERGIISRIDGRLCVTRRHIKRPTPTAAGDNDPTERMS